MFFISGVAFYKIHINQNEWDILKWNWNFQNTASLVDASLWYLKYFIVNISTGCTKYLISTDDIKAKTYIILKVKESSYIFYLAPYSRFLFENFRNLSVEYLLYPIYTKHLAFLMQTVLSGQLLSQSIYVGVLYRKKEKISLSTHVNILWYVYNNTSSNSY